MTQDTLTAALFLPATFAVASAIFSFGKRKSEPVVEEAEPIAAEPDADDVQDEEVGSDEDTEGETLPVLATFSLADDLYEDRAACEQVWDALALPVRVAGVDEPTRFFALSAFDPAPAGRYAIALTACKLAQDATQRGYSALLVDADVSRPTLHKLPLFAPRDGVAEATPTGLADFLRGDTTRLEPLLKLAWRTEGLLLLPAGNVAADDGTLTNGATWGKLLRLAAPLAEIVIVVAPPVFDADNTVRNRDILPKMDGVLVAYPSAFSAESDTEALEKMESMRVPQVGAIVAPPASYDGEDASSSVTEGTPLRAPEPIPDPEPVIMPEPVEVPEPLAVPGPLSAMEPPLTTPEPEAEPSAETEEMPTSTIVMVENEEPVLGTPATSPEVEKTHAPRPSFLSSPISVGADKPRRDARRTVPIENVQIYNAPPVHQSRPFLQTVTNPPPTANEAMPEPNNQPSGNSVSTNLTSLSYRPDVSIELLPTTGTTALLTLRADVGGTGSGPLLLLEIRTFAAEAKRLRADNPGSHAGMTANAPLLTLESLTAETASEDATTLRLVVKESNAKDAVTLLEAVLETPDALRIKSGKATAAGVPPVRFEVTTEPDDTARFRATIPPLDNTPSLFVDLERVSTAEGRLSRVVLRLA